MSTAPRITATSDLLQRALDQPRLLCPPPPAYALANLDYGMTIGVERTAGGRLWSCWVGGGDSEKGFFILASSDDDGDTWSDVRLAIDPHDAALPCARRTLVGALWRDPHDRLWLFFDQSLGYFDGRGGVWAARCDDPDAAQPVWTVPRRIWHGATLNKPIVLRDGTWLLPVSLWDRGRAFGLFEDAFHELDGLRGAHVFASRDDGETWQQRGHVVLPAPQFDEHHVVERRDGSLWLTARTALGLHEAHSHDGGRTWSDPSPSPIRQVVSAFGDGQRGNSSRHHLRRLRSGDLLLIKHGTRIDDAPGERSHLAAFVSADDGRTWDGPLLLDARATVSYPDAAEAPDGTIFATWDRDRDTRGEILLGRFSAADVRAGRLVTPGSRLGLMVSRPGRLARPAT